MPPMLEESLEVALRLAREACREVMKVYATEDFGVETKSDGPFIETWSCSTSPRACPPCRAWAATA